MHHKIRIAYLQLLRTAELCCFKAVSFATATLPEFDASALLVYSGCAGWSSLVARRAHNPKVVSSNLTPATNSRRTSTEGRKLHPAFFFWPKELGRQYRVRPSLGLANLAATLAGNFARRSRHLVVNVEVHQVPGIGKPDQSKTRSGQA